MGLPYTIALYITKGTVDTPPPTVDNDSRCDLTGASPSTGMPRPLQPSLVPTF